MSWTSPMTATTGNVLTAAQFNTNWRDNMLVSEAAVATGAGNLLVCTASAHTPVERTPQVEFQGGADSTTNTSFTTLADSPSIAITTGTKALVSIGAGVSNDTAAFGCRVGLDVSGATTIGATDSTSYYADSGLAGDGHQGTWVTIINLNAGFHLFDHRYRAVFGGTATFNRRLLVVIPF